MTDRTVTGNQSPQPVSYLHSKIRIGTCKGPINFKRNQNSFLPTDIPEEKRNRRKEIREWASSKILSQNQPWNKSTPCQIRPITQPRFSTNFVNDRSGAFVFNHRAESLDPLINPEPIDKPSKFHISSSTEKFAMRKKLEPISDLIQMGKFRRTEELPINLKLLGKKEWNSMTTLNLKEQAQRNKDFQGKSSKFSRNISKAISILDYKGPMELESIHQNRLRKMKSEGTFVAASFLDGEDMAPINKKGFSNRNALERPRVQTISEHSGVWEFNNHDNRFVTFIAYNY